MLVMPWWSRWLPARLPSDIPQYALLRGMRPLVATPDIRAAEEEAFTRHAELTDHLVGMVRAGSQSVALTTITTQSGGFVSLATQGLSILPVFTSSVRAIDYQECVAGPGTARVRHLSADELVSLFADGSQNITNWTLDPCPRCSMCNMYQAEQFQTPDDVFNVWAIARATTRLRTEVYVRHALELACAGDWRMAKYTLMCALQHVTLEEAQVHLLAGEIGIADGNRSVTEDASAWLRFLGFDKAADCLDADRAAADPHLSRIIVPVA
jgi:hypothetical protein